MYWVCNVLVQYLHKDTEKMYFKVNYEDKCVAQKMVDDKQCNILWYVDDNKLSNIYSKVNNDILGKPKVNFGDLSIQQGKKSEVPENGHHIPSRRFCIYWNGEVFKVYNCYVTIGDIRA